MGDHTAFFYGTLMAPAVLYRVIYGSSTPEPWQQKLTTVRPGLLDHFERHKVKYCEYPAIIPKKESNVRGSVVAGLTDADIYRLDIFEGSQYNRSKVRVKVLKDVDVTETLTNRELNTRVIEEVDAEAYVWCVSLSDLEEQEWDFEEFKREKMKYWVNGGDEENGIQQDEGFAEVDKAISEEGKRDPRGGRGSNGVISKQLDAA